MNSLLSMKSAYRGLRAHLDPDPPTTDPGIEAAEAEQEWRDEHARCMDCIWFTQVVPSTDEGERFFENRGVCMYLTDTPKEVDVCDACNDWEPHEEEQ